MSTLILEMKKQLDEQQQNWIQSLKEKECYHKQDIENIIKKYHLEDEARKMMWIERNKEIEERLKSQEAEFRRLHKVQEAKHARELKEMAENYSKIQDEAIETF